jgi:demethylmenaquinone methyltransferase / 2-methoxy-6-polyprenyl-1,4-benzoquinol methylase
MMHNDQAKLRLIHDVGFDRHFKASTWAEYNRQFFEALAEKYDATNVAHSFGTKKAIDRVCVRRLRIIPGSRILDLCTGSGDIAIQIAKEHPSARVIGVDASPAMLRVAERKAGPLLERIELVVGDALALHYPDGHFDGAIISFGLRNLSSLRAGLQEMKRVVKPGGFVSNIDQGRPKGLLFRAAYELHFRRLAPLLGKVIFHRGEFNSFRYLPESNRYFPNQDSLCAIMAEVGLEEVKSYDFWRGAVAQQIARVPSGVPGGCA